MKITDYAPRTATFDKHLTGSNLVGVEIGVDVGAHAESLLSYNPNIKKLHLIDVWEKPIYQGYCWGRLDTKGFMHKISMHKMTSIEASSLPVFKGDYIFDFIYLDQFQGYDSVKFDLSAWWPKLKSGGVLGQRNYSSSNEGLMRAIDEFLENTQTKDVVLDKYANEIIIFKQ